MGKVLRIIGAIVAALAGWAAVTLAVARLKFKRDASDAVRELFDRRSRAVSPPIKDEDLDNLPEPVRQWLKNAGVVGTSIPVAVRLKQEGAIRRSNAEDWMPLKANEYYTINPPGFVWIAEVKMSPLVSLAGLDAFLNGHGRMDIKVLSLAPVVHARGAEIDQGAAMRYLNEITWFPAAALSPAISWAPVDEHSAVATLDYEGGSVSATFFFDDQYRVRDMIARRFRDTGEGDFELSTWSTPMTEYGVMAGVRVPVEGVGVWKLNNGDFSYIKVKITEIEYNVAAEY